MTYTTYTALLTATGAVERTTSDFDTRQQAEAALAAFRLQHYADRGALAYVYTLDETGACHYFRESDFYGATVQTVEGEHPLVRIFNRALASGQSVVVSTGA